MATENIGEDTPQAPEEYRLYTLTNMYLSQIQRGIQTAHVTHELFHTHQVESLAKTTLHDWATYHKTIIVLNGGYQSELERVYDEFVRLGGQLYLPMAKFREEGDSLNHALTAIGIVLPSSVYNMSLPKGVAVFLEGDEPESEMDIDALGQDTDNCTSAIWVTDETLIKIQLRQLLQGFSLA